MCPCRACWLWFLLGRSTVVGSLARAGARACAAALQAAHCRTDSWTLPTVSHITTWASNTTWALPLARLAPSHSCGLPLQHMPLQPSAMPCPLLLRLLLFLRHRVLCMHARTKITQPQVGHLLVLVITDASRLYSFELQPCRGVAANVRAGWFIS